MHSLYKYYSERRWADAFLDGEMLFRSLAYFRDIEDNQVREDQNEGTAIFRPKDGLVVTNHTQGTTFTLADYAFESSVNQEEIFVFCASKTLSDKMRDRFGAIVCVEILDIKTFCTRVEAALPSNSTFPGRPGRTHIGNRVEYYRETDGGDPRWALPDVIATSKLDQYAWQDEYRLVFCLTDALAFEKVSTRLVRGQNRRPANLAEHHSCLVKTRCLRDVCRLRQL